MIAPCVAMLFVLTSPGDPAPAKFSIRTDLGGKPQAVEVVGIDAANLKKLAANEANLSNVASLFAVSAKIGEKWVPIPGRYRVDGDVLRFEPKFPMDPDLAHLATFDPSQLPVPAAKSGAIEHRFTSPKAASLGQAKVVRVDPATDRVPENLLKIYIHFSQPMSRGEAYKRVALMDASGKKLDMPFLEIGEELWDPSGTRITLLLDPGRVKRGLKPREEEGPILEEGKTYTLVVDENWPDANGRPLKETFRKTFKAVAPIEARLDVKTWKLEAPEAGTSDPLTITFPRPLDRALLDRAFEVLDRNGRRLNGTATIDRDETRWQFRPESRWETGGHHVLVDPTLEDLAGNSLARAFEVDLVHPVGEPDPKPVDLPFTIASPRGK